MHLPVILGSVRFKLHLTKTDGIWVQPCATIPEANKHGRNLGMERYGNGSGKSDVVGYERTQLGRYHCLLAAADRSISP